MTTADRKPSCRIQTRCLIISDTHGMQLPVDIRTPVDVAIHCGYLTQHSKLDEFRATVELIEKISAPLKLIIAGNHDFSLDALVFEQKISEANRVALEPLDDALIRKEFGDHGAARQILQQSRDKGIVFLDEGSHQFSLQNGALLRIYASPYTPSTTSASEWGFQYSGLHNFGIDGGTDIVATHGPPHGIMNISTEKKRIGCRQLFAAVAKDQPQLHCFGHAHDGWGARLVTWRSKTSDTPSHFTDIDNDQSCVIENMMSLKGSEFESTEERITREERIAAHRQRGFCETSHYGNNMRGLGHGQTLFVNAAIAGHDSMDQLPWVVNIELPASV